MKSRLRLTFVNFVHSLYDSSKKDCYLNLHYVFLNKSMTQVNPLQFLAIVLYRKLLTITLTPRNGVEDDPYVLLPAKNVFWIVSSHFEFQTSNHSYLLSHITTNFDVLILKELLGGRREATFYWQFMTKLLIKRTHEQPKTSLKRPKITNSYWSW